jgi:hypothetical protein
MPTTNANSPKVEKPVLLEAINFTFRTIEQRARQYRNLLVAVSLTGAGSYPADGLRRDSVDK